MRWLTIAFALAFVGAALVHPLGPAIAVLVGTGLPLAAAAAMAMHAGWRHLCDGQRHQALALEALGFASLVLLAAMGRWAWVTYF